MIPFKRLYYQPRFFFRGKLKALINGLSTERVIVGDIVNRGPSRLRRGSFQRKVNEETRALAPNLQTP